MSHASVRSWEERFPDQCFDGISVDSRSKKRSRKRSLRCHQNVDLETVLPRTGLKRRTPEKPSAYFTTAKPYVRRNIYIYI